MLNTILQSICLSAVEYAHNKVKDKVTHRDIKPQNIFIDRQGYYKRGYFCDIRRNSALYEHSAKTGDLGREARKYAHF